MKVLVAHHSYSSALPSGEDLMVHKEIQLLGEMAEIDLATFITSSDEISGPGGLALAAARTMGLVNAPRDLVSRIREFQPDLLHVHNLLPGLGPRVFEIAADYNVKVVWSQHNYRLTCVNGLHVRSGAPCTVCVTSKSAVPGMLHGCYRDSRIGSAIVTIGRSRALASRSVERIDRFVCLTAFMRDWLERSGLPSERLVVRPTWAEDWGVATEVATGWAYVGRLDVAKGVRLLIDAVRRSPVGGFGQLRIAGDGPLRDEVANLAASRSDITFLGALSREGVRTLISSSSALIVPSLCFEGLPLVVVEAFSMGRPVLTTNHGSVGSLFSEPRGLGGGWAVPADADSIALALCNLSVADRRREGALARDRYAEFHSPDAARVSISEIYSDVLGDIT